MSEHEERNAPMEEQDERYTGDEEAREPEASGPKQDESANDELAGLKEENAQLFSRLQRLQADFDNYRKRMKTEKQDWATQAICDLVRELLPVIDNLERAKEAKGSAEALAEGVDLVYRQFLTALEKQGLSVIEACDTEFDPNCHHAIMQVECDRPENTVVEELQKGYKLQERVLRPSMVKVAK
ncbi:MAG: nucleotide exchange factor GrpE [Bacillota bacterium]|nr:nucleotide exchange factor GrpE [Bacillota bacterium]MDW7683460.1 nucleotide exchange factor GrpE [Bacillota bacterium]